MRDPPRFCLLNPPVTAESPSHSTLDWRPKCGLRLGPHFYATEAEAERMMARIVGLAKAGEGAPFSGFRQKATQRPHKGHRGT